MKRLILLTILIGFVIFGTQPIFATPDVNASGAILLDFETGRVLWEKNANNPMAMASTTKIMTAIIALEQGCVEDIVTVSARAAAAPRVKMHLQAGEKISLGGLLLALMLQSSNDAAIAIAEHIGGSVENFCAAMTTKAAELGCLDTIFETPNGLDAGDHHSTAFDMAIIARYALQNPDFVRLIATPDISVSSSRTTYAVSNKNRLLREFQGATGVKTGFTNKAGHCFVGSAQRDEMQLISVVFASGWGDRGREQKWIDTKKILAYGFENYIPTEIITAGDIGGHLQIERSKTTEIPLVYGENIRLPLNEAERQSLKIEHYFPENIRAPIDSGQPMGSARIYIGENFAAEIPLITANSATRHDLKTSLEKVIAAYLRAATLRELNITLPEF